MGTVPGLAGGVLLVSPCATHGDSLSPCHLKHVSLEYPSQIALNFMHSSIGLRANHVEREGAAAARPHRGLRGESLAVSAPSPPEGMGMQNYVKGRQIW